MILNDTRTISLNLITGELIETKVPTKILDPEIVGVESKIILDEISGHKDIAISFKKMTDGSAYSLAAKIKEMTREIELHAVGKINQEICYFLKRSGFQVAHFDSSSDKSVFIQNTEELDSVINPFSEHYQPGKDNSEGVF